MQAAGLTSPWLVALALAVGAGVPLAWVLVDTASAPAREVRDATPRAPGAASTVVVAEPATAALQGPAPASMGVLQHAPSAVPVAPATAAAVALAIPRQRDPGGDTTPDIADYINAGEQPSMAEVIARLQAAGVRSGLGAFSPPGTKPPLVGLAVPDDFELPAGYVRHHQTTDDGQPIEPILMYAPDVRLLDAQGRALTQPADRVVPVDRAPPGLPLRRIVVPAPAVPGK